MSLSIVFPGQGSQSLNMIDSFKENKSLKDLFNLSSDILGKDMWKMATGGSDEINTTTNTQPLILISSVAIYNIWKEISEENVIVTAGHSLGEYSALVAASVISFEDALKIVDFRSKLMQNAVTKNSGTVLVVLGLNCLKIDEICKSISTNKKFISVANINSPEQIVIAGHKSLESEVTEKLRKANAKKVIPLSISVPVHCNLMKPISIEFKSFLREFNYSPPKFPILHNIDNEEKSRPDDIVDALSQQLFNKVNWYEIVRKISKRKVKFIVEIGPNKVLTGLNKRIVKEIKCRSTHDILTLKKTIYEIENDR